MCRCFCVLECVFWCVGLCVCMCMVFCLCIKQNTKEDLTIAELKLTDLIPYVFYS